MVIVLKLPINNHSKFIQLIDCFDKVGDGQFCKWRMSVHYVQLNFEIPECLIYAKQAIYETDVEAVLINIRYDVLAPVTETAVCVYNCLMALDSA